MKSLTLSIVSLILLTFLSSCSNSNGSSGSTPKAISAPTSIVEKTYAIKVIEGSGVFASKGEATITFSKQAYEIKDGKPDIVDDKGTYTYSALGAVGTIKTKSENGNEVSYKATYTTASSGTYTAESGQDKQKGTFTEK